MHAILNKSPTMMCLAKSKKQTTKKPPHKKICFSGECYNKNIILHCADLVFACNGTEPQAGGCEAGADWIPPPLGCSWPCAALFADHHSA